MWIWGESVASILARVHSFGGNATYAGRRGKKVPSMYDRRLDAIIAAGECGSFNQAAHRLHLSATALIKQVTGFEHEYGLTLFERGSNGVRPTVSGRVLIEDARNLIRQSEQTLRRVRELEQSDESTVRLAISMLRPATPVLELWPRASAWLEQQRRQQLRLELVSMSDSPEGFMDALSHLGEEVDVAASGFSPANQQHPCRVLKLGEYPLQMGVPVSNLLYAKPVTALGLSDLEGQRIHIPQPGDNEAMDEARSLLQTIPGVTLIDMPQYTFEEFNTCAANGDLIVARTFGTGIHPMIRTMPVEWNVAIDYGLFYPNHPSEAVRRFVEAIAAVRLV